MKCAICGTLNTKVLSTREWMEGAMLRRRRECANGHRFSTVEVIDTKIVKKVMEPTARGITSKEATWLKHTAIVYQARAGKRFIDIGKTFGLTGGAVGKIIKRRAPELSRARS